jgi:DedD protein
VEIKYKQRLVGIMVLLSLAIIFLPSLFQRDQRVVVDTQTFIPPKPVVNPIVIETPPQSIILAPAPQPDDAFQPALEEETIVNDTASVIPKPTLNTKGLPDAWVVQVGSFQTQSRADQLKEALLKQDYKAYTRGVKTSKGDFYRVFVGPYIDKSRALSAKKSVDKQYKLTSQVVTFSPE